MTPERWPAIGDLFDGALAVATTERRDWVERTSDDQSTSPALAAQSCST
jgi:hypothetical protein